MDPDLTPEQKTRAVLMAAQKAAVKAAAGMGVPLRCGAAVLRQRCVPGRTTLRLELDFEEFPPPALLPPPA